MKRRLLILTSITLLGLTGKAQTVADFENLPLTAGSYWAGTATSGDSTFISGDAGFPNKYSTIWEKGWAYSSVKDSTTTGYTNNYGSRAGSGYNGSSNYAVGRQDSKIHLTGSSSGKKAVGMYINNGTYAALSMESGDQFAKEFGGKTGDDPDWFLLTVKGYAGGSFGADSVNFYLADFRDSDNTKDYIVKDWQWVDLQSLGLVDSLVFSLSSSDVGAFGMNTPGYFCMDDFTTNGVPSSVSESTLAKVNVYPNPANSTLNVASLENGAVVSVLNIAGNVVKQKTAFSERITFDLSNLESGIYVLNVISNGKFTQEKFIKK